jgi:hypothetical protein
MSEPHLPKSSLKFIARALVAIARLREREREAAVEKNDPHQPRAYGHQRGRRQADAVTKHETVRRCFLPM